MKHYVLLTLRCYLFDFIVIAYCYQSGRKCLLLSVCLCVCLSVMSVCMYVCLSVRPSVRLSFCLSVCMHVRMYAYLCICMYAHIYCCIIWFMIVIIIICILQILWWMLQYITVTRMHVFTMVPWFHDRDDRQPLGVHARFIKLWMPLPCWPRGHRRSKPPLPYVYKRIHMCICICICICMCMCVCVFVCIYIFIYIYIYVCMYTYAWTRMHTWQIRKQINFKQNI